MGSHGYGEAGLTLLFLRGQLATSAGIYRPNSRLKLSLLEGPKDKARHYKNLPAKAAGLRTAEDRGL